ncbi:hypothetical protein [Cupriavidus taiwanensis]|uniref:hypothetical protein n=1 Tax=Cupriavidus taiwanensis TaxID=164546 RepID=UPI000E1A1E20|nr:hypothetical protein [Cupriavidus taiwanensis]SPA44620.1 hypothetical protein CBM2629_A150422 [Cupriavidus taiwanensis]
MKPKITKCPSPAYKPYVPDQATRIAMERASKEQPPLVSLASSVPSHRLDGG